MRPTGITLVALVITIIVLLILAGVVLNMIMGENGIIPRARWAEFVTGIKERDEKQALEKLNGEVKEKSNKNQIASIAGTKLTGEKSENVITYYKIKGNRLDNENLEESLEKTIKNVENVTEITNEKIQLYQVDDEALNMKGKRDYIINIQSGKVYQYEAHSYKGKLWHRPECGIDEKTGEVVESEGTGNNEQEQQQQQNQEQNQQETNTKYSTSDYVQNGLVLMYDGIQNTREGNNPNATSWEDLSENENDGIFYNINIDSNNVTNTDKGYYSVEENGYVFLHNDAYVETTNNIGITGDANYTVEFVINPWSNGKKPNYSSWIASEVLWWGSTSAKANDTGKSAEFGYDRNTGTFAQWSLNNPVITDEDFEVYDKTNSISYRKTKNGEIQLGDTDVLKIYYNGENKSNSSVTIQYSVAKYTTNLQDSKLQIGRAWQYKNENRTFYGSIQCIRIYNRVLTDAEVQNNYTVDKSRFNIQTDEDD